MLRKKISCAVLLSMLIVCSPVEGFFNDFQPSLRLTVDDSLRVEDVQMFRDGGTIGIKVANDLGEELIFCLDGRMKSQSFWDKLSKHKEERQVFLNVMHPSVGGAQAIPIGGQMEQIILNILTTWLDRVPVGEREERKTHGVIRVVDVLNARKDSF